MNIETGVKFCKNGTFDLGLINKLRGGGFPVTDIFGCLNLTGEVRLGKVRKGKVCLGKVRFG